MDLTFPSQIKDCIEKVNLDVIIHYVAYTAVDASEDNEELCRQVNAYDVRDIAQCAKKS